MSDQPVSDAAGLAALITQLAAAPGIALDTEFLRERTYRPQLCLLQLAGNGLAFCVDPLADLDISALAPLLRAADKPKVLHAARQDLEVLWPVFGAPAPLYDTQVAAGLAGHPAQVGYSELVRRLLGIQLAKAETRTDWSRRPLSPAQLQYARDDVLHLHALRETLDAELARLGRLAWLEEELRDLADPAKLFVDPEKAVERLRWSAELDPDRARLAQRLAAWRERRAMERDRPRSWILDDAGLRSLVHKAPRSIAELAALPELTPGFVEHSGEKVLHEIESAGLPARLPPPAQRARPDPQLLERVKRLGAIVQRRAAELSMAPEILATRRDLESIARGAQDSDVLRGWRREVVGAALAAAL